MVQGGDQWERERCHLLYGEWRRNKKEKKETAKGEARDEQARRRPQEKKQAFFLWKVQESGNQKLNSRNFFLNKKFRNQARSKYDHLFLSYFNLYFDVVCELFLCWDNEYV